MFVTLSKGQFFGGRRSHGLFEPGTSWAVYIYMHVCMFNMTLSSLSSPDRSFKHLSRLSILQYITIKMYLRSGKFSLLSLTVHIITTEFVKKNSF